MIGQDDFQKAVELINKSSNVLITTHIKPDGDACGSATAMYDTLATLGKKVYGLMLSGLPGWYEFLFDEKVSVLGKDINLQQLKQGPFTESDLIIIIDTNSYSQLPGFDQYLKQTDKPVLVIDHHVTSDGLGEVELVDTSAAAAGLIVLDLLKFADWPVTGKIADALFVAIATDTGWFHFSNTDSRVFQSCAELINSGANPTELYHKLYQNFSQERLKLMAVMLNTLELHLGGRYAVQYLRRQDFEQVGSTYKDTENLIDECQRIGAVEAAALFVELPDGRVKCSLRSRDSIDVRKIAQNFGGGGHILAAGAHISGPLENAKQLVFERVKAQFEQLNGK